jgi:hypothetical protein
MHEIRTEDYFNLSVVTAIEFAANPRIWLLDSDC